MGVIMEIINMTSEDIGNLKKLSLDFLMQREIYYFLDIIMYLDY